MPTKPTSLIADANVIIELHRLGLWKRLCDRTRVLVPATVARTEVLYFRTTDSADEPEQFIDLVVQADQGAITIVEVSLERLDQTRRRFGPVMSESIHAGELEALAYLCFEAEPGCVLCSGDRAAITALVLLGLKEKSLSLERVLGLLSLSTRGLRSHFAQGCFDQWTRAASVLRVQGRGLAEDPFGSQ